MREKEEVLLLSQSRLDGDEVLVMIVVVKGMGGGAGVFFFTFLTTKETAEPFKKSTGKEKAA